MYRIPRYSITLTKDGSFKSEIKKITKAEDAYEIMKPMMENLPVEHFQIIMLDAKCQVIGTSLVTIGTINENIVTPIEIFQRAILANSKAIILVHNHPSGDPKPSREDIALTKQIVEGGKILQIAVLDHIIIGDDKFISLKVDGYI
ncbi:MULTISPECIES: JAB domain-containing protein [Pelosinus]|uniref:DNA repair protein RadC n=1 Tax=Pelosinus fermentans B4 TaxID=1149862 RepID=I9L9I9_9FIRM|nr:MULTISPECIES: DNA repair protein RadC [Pelosinus]EIW17064.1 DNA repair protein RadC [Pelosinus fermentans B4]EIW23137.1 DNA repair protein RadC [Pelosinus fermentans A11]OAM93821.1 DNA repair protein RadC [Pelosinus fermentans DSM 17108]SDQ91230.1 DNA repair protein RadC [Pelosinus fermentans]